LALDLTLPPDALTARQRTIAVVAAVVCAASRFLAMAPSIWDWDEALFTLGMRSYDVTQHHPHPPGFPIFIGVAHLFRAVVPSDFRALQAISLLAGVCLFPAMFFLARELRMRFETALLAAALLAFFPNVWFFGGTAFSDVPSIVLVVAAVAFLLRGCRSPESYLAGSLLLALAIGIRPQNFLIGLVPGVIATWYRRRQPRDIVVAALIGVAIVGVAFGGAIRATGSYEKYMSAVRAHGEYIARVDSFRSPDRPPLWRLVDRFFLKQYDAPALSLIVSILVLVSAAGAIRERDGRMLVNVLTFGPMAVLAWLMLDRYSISRFSIGYIPMFAILAADGIERVTRNWPRVELAAGGLLVAGFVAWTLPALNEARSGIAPTIAASSEIAKRLDPKHDRLFVAFNMTPFVEVAAPGWKYTRVYKRRGLPLFTDGDGRRPWVLTELTDLSAPPPGAFVARRDKGHLWNIARRLYFDVALMPMTALPQWTEGWYDPELTETDEYRWCGARGVVRLPAASGETNLVLDMDLPVGDLPHPPNVTVLFNGAILDKFAATDENIVREWHVTPAANGAPNVLELSTDETYNAVKRHEGDDPRDLGIRLHYLSFGPA
jgi:hypothetical protein